MPWIAAAVVGAGAIGAIGATSAANTQAGAAENAQNISQNEFNTITAQEQPFLQGGYGALSSLEYGLGIGGSPGGSYGGTGPAASNRARGGGTGNAAGGAGYGSLVAPFTTSNWQQLSPAYNFQLGQGQQNVLNSDAAGQGALSGSALKDITSYNQGMANTSFNNAFNMYQTQQGNIFNRLSGIAGLGSSAAANLGAQGTQLAGQAAQSATNIGTAQAGGTVGAANALSGSLSSSIPWLYAGSAGGGGGNNQFLSPNVVSAGNSYNASQGYYTGP